MSVDDGRALDLAALGGRVRSLRQAQWLSLDALAARADVSRSMISAIERGGKAPTVIVLDRIATALDTSLARLLGEERSARAIVLRRDEQDVARDPSGWERRILSPVLPDVEFELMQTTIPPGVDAGVFAPHAPGSREHLVVLRGTLRLTLDGVAYLLGSGDAIYYAGNCAHGFACAGEEPCVYILAMQLAAPPAHGPSSRHTTTGHRRARAPRHGSAEMAPQSPGIGASGASTSDVDSDSARSQRLP